MKKSFTYFQNVISVPQSLNDAGGWLVTEIDLRAQRKRFLIKWISIAISCIALYLLAFWLLIDKRPLVEWTLIKSGAEKTQPDSQLIKMPDGQVLLINAGEAAGSLLFYLKKQKIKDVDLLLLTSFDDSALSALKEMLKKGIRIKEVWVNPFSVETHLWIENKNQFLKKGTKIENLDSSKVLYSKLSTELQVLALEKDSLVLRLIHEKNSLAVGLGNPSGLGSQLAKQNCTNLRTEVLLNFTDLETKAPYLDWIGCLKPVYDLSAETGTFKILLKGDSFKLKRG